MEEGRYKVRVTANGSPVMDGQYCDGDHYIQVVPCDDAAVERVARAIRAENLHLSLPTCFERARGYLRAAGETP